MMGRPWQKKNKSQWFIWGEIRSFSLTKMGVQTRLKERMRDKDTLVRCRILSRIVNSSNLVPIFNGSPISRGFINTLWFMACSLRLLLEPLINEAIKIETKGFFPFPCAYARFGLFILYLLCSSFWVTPIIIKKLFLFSITDYFLLKESFF